MGVPFYFINTVLQSFAKSSKQYENQAKSMISLGTFILKSETNKYSSQE